SGECMSVLVLLGPPRATPLATPSRRSLHFFSMLRPPPRPTLFPYTTLFRSLRRDPFTNRHRQQDQRNGGFHHRQRHLHTSKTRSLHHHQFAALRQHPKTKQRPKQSCHREEDLHIFRHAQQGIHSCA